MYFQEFQEKRQCRNFAGYGITVEVFFEKGAVIWTLILCSQSQSTLSLNNAHVEIQQIKNNFFFLFSHNRLQTMRYCVRLIWDDNDDDDDDDDDDDNDDDDDDGSGRRGEPVCRI